jgi:hypothetical protein
MHYILSLQETRAILRYTVRRISSYKLRVEDCPDKLTQLNCLLWSLSARDCEPHQRSLCWQTAHILLQCISSRTRLGLDYCAVIDGPDSAIMPLRHSPRHKRPSWTTLHASLTDRKVAVWVLVKNVHYR